MKVQTVLGSVDPAELGVSLPHEHLLIDISPALLGAASGNAPTDRDSFGSTELDEELLHAPMRMDNLDKIRRTWGNLASARMTSEEDAVRELEWFTKAGGRTIIDSTSIGLGRDPKSLVRISEASGVNVIMGSGWYVYEMHPPNVAEATEEELYLAICKEFEVGVGDTGVRPGIIGEIGMSWPPHPDEEKVLRAAARAAATTGAALQIHPGRDRTAPLRHIEVASAAGASPARIIICHIERTLFTIEEMCELAATGCYLEFDLFGIETSGYPSGRNIDIPNDGTRIDYLAGLIEAGHLEQLLISHDLAGRAYQRSYGGWGYAHILENVVPIMKRKGLTDQEIDTIMVGNVARAVAMP